MTASAPSRTAFATSEVSARVGTGLEIIDSSICVATMTGFAMRRASSTARFCTIGTASSGSSTPEVAAGDHDAVERVDDLFEGVDRLRLLDLRDDRDLAALLGHDLEDPVDVRGVAHERQRDVVGAELEAPAQVGFVLLRQRGHVDGDAGEVDALVVRDRAGDDALGLHLDAVGLEDLDLDLAVVDQQEVAGRHVVRQALEGRADEVLGADDVLGRDRQDVADLEVVRTGLELAEADLRPLQVDRAPRPAARCRPRPCGRWRRPRCARRRCRGSGSSGRR